MAPPRVGEAVLGDGLKAVSVLLRITTCRSQPSGTPAKRNPSKKEMLALCEERRIVTPRFGAELGDREMGRETPGDGAHFGRLRKQPGKAERAGQDEMGMSPVRIDLDHLAQALDAVNHSPEIDIGETDKKMPLEEERIARTEPHRFLDMGASLVRRPSKSFMTPA